MIRRTKKTYRDITEDTIPKITNRRYFKKLIEQGFDPLTVKITKCSTSVKLRYRVDIGNYRSVGPDIKSTLAFVWDCYNKSGYAGVNKYA